MNEEPRRVLWTGGFDSTWLVVDALATGYRVEAVVWRGYGMQPGWQKVDREDEARRRIAWALPRDLRARLRQRVEADYVRAYPLVHAAWEELTDRLGAAWSHQNEILAAIPALVGPVESGHVADDQTTRDPVQREVLVRAGVRLPLAETTKPELLADARRRGFDDLLAQTWSCERTTDDPGPLPCGECMPCLHRLLP